MAIELGIFFFSDVFSHLFYFSKWIQPGTVKSTSLLTQLTSSNGKGLVDGTG